jgi:hypothetical protein
MNEMHPALQVWKLTVITVVAAVLLIDLHSMFRSITTSVDKVAESYVKQSDSVSNGTEEMVDVLLPPEARKEYRRLSDRAHHVLIQQLDASLSQAEHAQQRPVMHGMDR